MKTGTNNHLYAPDRVYGEIYEANGIYWAEVIVFQDGFDSVVEQSADFVNRKQAAHWLQERKLKAAPTAEEIVEELSAKAVALAKRVAQAFGLGGRVPNAA